MARMQVSPVARALNKVGLFDTASLAPTDTNRSFWGAFYNMALSTASRNYLSLTTGPTKQERGCLKMSLCWQSKVVGTVKFQRKQASPTLKAPPSFHLLFKEMDKTELLNPVNLILSLFDLIKYGIFSLIDLEVRDGKIGNLHSSLESYKKDHPVRYALKVIIECLFSLITLPLRLFKLLTTEPASYSADIIKHWGSASGKQKALAVAGLIWSIAVATVMAFTIIGIKTHTLPIVAKLAHTVSAVAGKFLGHLGHTAAAKITLCCRKALLWTGAYTLVRNVASACSSFYYSVASCFGRKTHAAQVHPTSSRRASLSSASTGMPDGAAPA